MILSMGHLLFHRLRTAGRKELYKTVDLKTLLGGVPLQQGLGDLLFVYTAS